MNKKKKSQMLNKCKVHLNMNQLSLVVRQAIEQKNSQIQELKYKVDNLKSFFQGELQNIADKKTQEITKLNEKNAKELEEEKQRYKML
jgi:DNA anti-recombination protein RmuC